MSSVEEKCDMVFKETLEDEHGHMHETIWTISVDGDVDAYCDECTDRNICYCLGAYNNKPPNTRRAKPPKTKTAATQIDAAASTTTTDIAPNLAPKSPTVPNYATIVPANLQK